MKNTLLDPKYTRFIHINRTSVATTEVDNKIISKDVCEKIANKILEECHYRFLGGATAPHISKLKKIPTPDNAHVGAKDEKIPFTPVQGVYGQSYCAWHHVPYGGNLHNAKKWYTFSILIEKVKCKGSKYLVHWSRIDHHFEAAIVAELLLDEGLQNPANAVITHHISLGGETPNYSKGVWSEDFRIGKEKLEALVNTFRRVHHTNS